MGNNPSYVWRCIMMAQGSVKEGLRWQVGNGSKARVWNDKWLSYSSTYKSNLIGHCKIQKSAKIYTT